MNIRKTFAQVRQQRAAQLRILLVLAVAALWALVLLAPSAKAPAPSRAALTPLTASELAQIDAQGAAVCASRRAARAGYVTLPDGALVCTDRPARKPRSVITIPAHQLAQR